jgi:hypothetical protein
MTIICNLLGGPGVGKSTTATGVFSRLKREGVSVEYVNEFAKELVYEGTTALLENQLFVFGEQFRRQWRLLNKVSYVITDSPLLLSAVYFKHWNNKTNRFSKYYLSQAMEFIGATYSQFTNENWIIQRNKPYDPNGRLQTDVEEAIALDEEVQKLMRDWQISYNVTDSQKAIDDITTSILLRECKSI